jgi:RnfABCDGE-type electron transport complex B subunit
VTVVTATFSKTLADQIEDRLPQTQCTKCGYPACRPYAEAIAAGEANYNQCPPGGQEGVVRLASLLGMPVIALNPDNGVERSRPLAIIDENLCIGCTLCLQVCPVDAIIGAAKQMHTIIPELCTGCDLCVPPCPVDCIAMVPVTGEKTGWGAWNQQEADAARERHDASLVNATRPKRARRHAWPGRRVLSRVLSGVLNRTLSRTDRLNQKRRSPPPRPTTTRRQKSAPSSRPRWTVRGRRKKKWPDSARDRKTPTRSVRRFRLRSMQRKRGDAGLA